jgi:tetratricopeptide (TPR) repeat protein
MFAKCPDSMLELRYIWIETMTLIVAKKFKTRIVLIGDTQKSNELTQERYRAEDPQLKIAIVENSYAIAFAGKVVIAQKAIEEVHELQNKNLETISKKLLEFNLQSKGEASFILASLVDDKLLAIKEGKAEETVSAWLGNGKAYDIFKTTYAEKMEMYDRLKKTDPDNSPFKNYSEEDYRFTAMSPCLKTVISSDDREIQDVGGFPIVLFGTKENKKFEFQITVEMIAENPIKIEGTGDWQPVPFGNAETGAHKIEIYSCQTETSSALAIFFKFGNFGFYWKPSLLDERIKKTNVTKIEFFEALEEELNLKTGFMFGWEEHFETALKHIRTSEDRFLTNINKAIEIVEKNINLANSADFSRLYEIRGAYFLEKNYLEDARFDNIRALEIKPGNYKVINDIGCIYEREGKLEEALALFERALTYDTANEIILENIQNTKTVLQNRKDQSKDNKI